MISVGDKVAFRKPLGSVKPHMIGVVTEIRGDALVVDWLDGCGPKNERSTRWVMFPFEQPEKVA